MNTNIQDEYIKKILGNSCAQIGYIMYFTCA